MTNALLDALDREAGAVAAFAQCCADERDAMKRADYPALAALVARKTELADALARHSSARESAMAGCALRIGAAGELLGDSIDPAVADAWRRLRRVALAARDANRLNEAIVTAQLEFGRKAIHALRTGGADAGLYGRNGRAQSGVKGVSLASG